MPKPSDLARELEALDERPRAFDETGDLPRSKLPALFRAARAAAAAGEAGAELLAFGEKLGSRLPDRALLEPIREIARDLPVIREPLLAALARRAAAPDAWGIERLARELAGAQDPLEAILELTREAPGIDLSIERLLALVEVRLASSRRDRTSLEATRGALRLLAKHGRDPRVSALAARVVEAETRRCGKEEPELALAALDLLALAAPLPLLRMAKRLERRVERKKVEDRLGELAAGAISALAASPEDVLDLLADDLGLDERGVLRIPLEAGDAVLSVGRTGEVEVRAPGSGRLAPDDQREVNSARARLVQARSEHGGRLERALGAGRAWKLALFRAIFLENPLLRDLASRLVWLALPERVAVRPGPSDFTEERGAEPRDFEDVFGGPFAGFSEGTMLRLAHPVELDADELGLWRERAGELGRQPFPQLHRLVAKEKDPLERFVGRELHQADMAELGRKRGYRGLPLRGDGPWELARDMPGFGSVLAVTLERIAGQLIVPKRRDALRVLDDPDAKPRERREDSPRARIAKVELVGEDGDVAKAEAALDLHALTDPLAAGTDAGFGEWQKKKFKDPAASWRDAQLIMMKGSEAAVSVRAALVRAFEPGVRIEGRLAILGGDDGLYVDLGTRQTFEGPLRDWVPPWRLDDRWKGKAPPELDWPFDPAQEEETVLAVTTVVALARVLKSVPPQGAP